MMPDYLVARAAVETQQEKEFQRARATATTKIEEEKAKFKASVIARRKREADAERTEERLAVEQAEREEEGVSRFPLPTSRVHD